MTDNSVYVIGLLHLRTLPKGAVQEKILSRLYCGHDHNHDFCSANRR